MGLSFQSSRFVVQIYAVRQEDARLLCCNVGCNAKILFTFMYVFVPGKRFSLALPMLPVWKRYRLGYVFIVKKVHIVIDYNF